MENRFGPRTKLVESLVAILQGLPQPRLQIIDSGCYEKVGDNPYVGTTRRIKPLPDEYIRALEVHLDEEGLTHYAHEAADYVSQEGLRNKGLFFGASRMARFSSWEVVGIDAFDPLGWTPLKIPLALSKFEIRFEDLNGNGEWYRKTFASIKGEKTD